MTPTAPTTTSGAYSCRSGAWLSRSVLLVVTVMTAVCAAAAVAASRYDGHMAPGSPPPRPAQAIAMAAAAQPTPGAGTLQPTASPSPPPPAPSPSPVPLPSATGSVSPPPTPPAPPKPLPDCGVFDLGCKVEQTMNGWFKSLVAGAIVPVFTALGSVLLATPQVEQIPRVQQIWSWTLVVANSLFVLLVIAGGLIVMGYETLQTSYTVKDIAPRLIVAFAAANFSALVVGKAIEAANALAAALLGPGINPQTAAQLITDRIEQNMDAGSLFLLLLVLAAVVFAVLLALLYVIRLTVTIVLVAAAPLALACHALPQLDGVARLWWRALTGVLAIQVVQALVFIVALRVMLTRDGTAPITGGGQFMDMLVVICLLYVQVRIPSWISHLVMQGGLGRSPVGHLARYVVLRATLYRAVNRHGPSRRGRRGRGRRT